METWEEFTNSHPVVCGGLEGHLTAMCLGMSMKDAVRCVFEEVRFLRQQDHVLPVGSDGPVKRRMRSYFYVLRVMLEKLT